MIIVLGLDLIAISISVYGICFIFIYNLQEFKTYQNLSKLIKTYQNLSKLIKTYQNLSKHIKTYQNLIKLNKTIIYILF